MSVKVAKFGGSSVADTIQFTKVRDIVFSDPARKFVVVSAPGKRFNQDTKMTDLLLLCHTHLMNHLPWDQLFQVVCDRFSAIAFTLEIGQDKLDLYHVLLQLTEAALQQHLSAVHDSDMVADILQLPEIV